MSLLSVATSLAMAALLVGGSRIVCCGGLCLRRFSVRSPKPDSGQHLADVLDLLSMCAASGLDVVDSLGVVYRHGAGTVARRLGPVISAIVSGRPLTSALSAGDIRPSEPLGIVLAALREAHVDGAAVEGRLDVIATDLRRIARSREQASARKLSVRLLIPLVICMLPAFALVTVVPVIIDATT